MVAQTLWKKERKENRRWRRNMTDMKVRKEMQNGKKSWKERTMEE